MQDVTVNYFYQWESQISLKGHIAWIVFKN